MNPTGILIFHQGFTDIFNCLGLIDYFLGLKKYDKIYIILREEIKEAIDFFIKEKERTNIIPAYFTLEFINKILCSYINNKTNYDEKGPAKYFAKLLNIIDYEPIFIGFADIYNWNTLYKSKFGNYMKNSPLLNNSSNFVKGFYDSYNIDYNLRYINFSFTRNIEEEDAVYNDFISKYGEKYILNHNIDMIENKDNLPIINLDRITYKFFDYIKVLENSEELHLLDSVWGAFIYLLDCKYNLFNNRKIYIYCKRNYSAMYLEPIQKENFIFV
jgi:hypothetical protein